MRLGALILGLIGALGGLLYGGTMILAIRAAKYWSEATGQSFAETAGIKGIESPDMAQTLGWLGVIGFAVAVVGAALAVGKPRTAGTIMLISAGAALLLGIITPATGISAGFLIVAAIICLKEAKKAQEATEPKET